MHWTIIGGGIQGTTVAIKLRNEGISSNQLTIIILILPYVNNSTSIPNV